MSFAASLGPIIVELAMLLMISAPNAEVPDAERVLPIPNADARNALVSAVFIMPERVVEPALSWLCEPKAKLFEGFPATELLRDPYRPTVLPTLEVLLLPNAQVALPAKVLLTPTATLPKLPVLLEPNNMPQPLELPVQELLRPTIVAFAPLARLSVPIVIELVPLATFIGEVRNDWMSSAPAPRAAPEVSPKITAAFAELMLTAP